MREFLSPIGDEGRCGHRCDVSVVRRPATLVLDSGADVDKKDERTKGRIIHVVDDSVLALFPYHPS